MENILAQIGSDDAEAANFKRIFEESPAPMYIFDLHTYEFLAVNVAALNQYEYQREEFLSMKALQIRSVEEAERFKSAIQQVKITYFDYGVWKHIRKSGEEFFVHIYGHSNIFQNREARIVMVIDVDQKVKVENALKEKNIEIADSLAFFSSNLLYPDLSNKSGCSVFVWLYVEAGIVFCRSGCNCYVQYCIICAIKRRMIEINNHCIR